MNNVQKASGEYSRYPDFLEQGHLKTPNPKKGDYEYSPICDDVDYTAYNEHCIIIKTVSWQGWLPNLSPRHAGPYLHRYVSQVEKHIEPDDEMDSIVCFGSWGYHKDSEI